MRYYERCIPQGCITGNKFMAMAKRRAYFDFLMRPLPCIRLSLYRPLHARFYAGHCSWRVSVPRVSCFAVNCKAHPPGSSFAFPSWTQIHRLSKIDKAEHPFVQDAWSAPFT